MKPLTNPTPMMLTLGVWICTLPFLLLVTIPLFGLKVAGVAAAGFLVALALVCRGVCALKVGTP